MPGSWELRELRDHLAHGDISDLVCDLEPALDLREKAKAIARELIQIAQDHGVPIELHWSFANVFDGLPDDELLPGTIETGEPLCP